MNCPRCSADIGTLSACWSCGAGTTPAPRRQHSAPYQRRSSTSRAGAVAAAPKAPSQRDIIVAWVRENGPATNNEIKQALGYEINVVSARVNAETGKGGRLQRAGTRPCRITGNYAQTVEAVEVKV